MKRYVKGSYTIEAALIMPAAVFLMAFVMGLAFELYQETSKELQSAKETAVTQPAVTVRRIKRAGELAGELK